MFVGPHWKVIELKIRLLTFLETYLKKKRSYLQRFSNLLETTKVDVYFKTITIYKCYFNAVLKMISSSRMFNNVTFWVVQTYVKSDRQSLLFVQKTLG